MNIIDLQIHSSASDGKYSPPKLVRMARELGLTTIAITDHDTIDGVNEAVKKGEELEVGVIPGIEMSVTFKNIEIHILGYGIDIFNEDFRSRLTFAQDDRQARAKKMVELLQKEGFAITYDDVLKHAKGGSVGRPHVSLAVLENPKNKEKLGNISSTHEFIRAYIVPGKAAYVDRVRMDAKTAIDAIHAIGGIAIWSHPAIHFQNNYSALDGALKSLIELGLDGIEAFNPSHTENDIRFLLPLALQNNLLITAGSDFHREEGFREMPEGLHSARSVGDFETFGHSIGDIIPELKEAIKKRGGKL